MGSRYNLALVGVWRSLVAHLVWDQGVQGSNPCTPTKNHEKKPTFVGFFFRWLKVFANRHAPAQASLGLSGRSLRLKFEIDERSKVRRSPVFAYLLKLFLKIAVVKRLSHVAVEATLERHDRFRVFAG